MSKTPTSWILRHLSIDLIQAIERKAYHCEVSPDHPDPDYRIHLVADLDDVKSIIENIFSELIEEMR